MRFASFFLFLLSPALMAQTASVPASKVSGTAHINAQSASCTVPKNGGTCKFSFPAYDAVVVGATAQITASVNLSGTNLNFTITLTPEQAQQLQQVFINGGSVTIGTIQLVKP